MGNALRLVARGVTFEGMTEHPNYIHTYVPRVRLAMHMNIDSN